MKRVSNEKVFDDIKIKDEFLPFLEVEDMVGGKKLIIDHPFNGRVEVDFYDVLPEIRFIETKSHHESSDSNYQDLFFFNNPNLVIMNCIIKGTCQVPVGDDKYVFLKDGDMNIFHIQESYKTLNYGEDTHILFIILRRSYGSSLKLKDPLNISRTINDLFGIVYRHSNLIYYNNRQIKEILEQIVNFQPAVSNTKTTYQLIKFLELMIHVYNFDIPEENLKQHTYTDSQIRVVRKIKNMISCNISSYDSVESLSQQYGINSTTLKACFKEMYGKPIYSWYRSYKFQRAKELIKNTDYTISKVANMIGYKNSSKFSKAFKEQFGVLPSAYRKKKKK